jgi:hypothetical protein
MTRWHRETVRIFLTSQGFTNVTLRVDDIGRWRALKNTILHKRSEEPTVTNQQESSTAENSKPEIFHKPNSTQKLLHRSIDATAFVAQTLLGNVYGQYLIAYAQKPQC